MATPIPTAGELGTVFSQIPTPLIFIALGLGAVGYWVYTNYDRRAFEEYERKPLEEKVMEDLKYRLRKTGKNVSKALTKDRRALANIGYFDKLQMREDTLITPDMDAGKPDEDDFKEVYVFMSAKGDNNSVLGKIERYTWWIQNFFFNASDPDIFILEAESVANTRKEFVVDDEIQFLPTTYAGVLIQDSQACTNVVQQIATVDAEGQITNGMAEFLSKVEHFEIEHLKNMNELEKEGEIERMRQEGLFEN